MIEARMKSLTRNGMAIATAIRQHHADDRSPAERQDRLIRPVGRLELASFAVIHRSIPYTLSMIFSPNRPCGRNSRKTSAIM
jgi:hypothetical protein